MKDLLLDIIEESFLEKFHWKYEDKNEFILIIKSYNNMSILEREAKLDEEKLLWLLFL